MLLYLTSKASNTLIFFVPFLPKNPSLTKVAFIPTAGDLYSEKPWIDDDRNKLIELGFRVFDLDIKNQKVDFLKEKLNDADIIFVAGGNTTYLLQQMQKSNCLNLIKEKILNGTVYIGSSAGSILAGPNIEFDRYYADSDDELISLNSYESLNLVNFVVLPHANKQTYLDVHQKIINDFKNKYNFELLKDNQAIIVIDDKTKLIEI